MIGAVDVSAVGEEIPLVSVVIPTMGRPELVQRAIRSALGQTHPRIEVVVVSDGPDAETAALLRDSDARVRHLQLDSHAGPAAARWAGLQASAGEWINFLDDDDELLPEKVASQLAVAEAADGKTMIACRCFFEQAGERNVWPARAIGEGESLGDYLLLRPGLRGRPGLVNLHCLLIPRGLALAVPMPNFADHEDWAWLLALWYEGGGRVRFLWETLAVYHLSSTELTRSRRFNWAESLEWAEAHRRWISKRAFNSFLATKVALKARRAGSWKGVWRVVREVVGNGGSWVDMAFLVGIVGMPVGVMNWYWKRSLKSGQK